MPQARLHAVASRSLTKAQEFATTQAVPHAVGSYEALLAVPDIDAAYIATPHSEHHAHALLCLHAGLPVLCEKAFAQNAGQVREMIELAQVRGIFLMEAFWTRFFPTIQHALELVRAGAIGEVKYLSADFGFMTEFKSESQLLTPSWPAARCSILGYTRCLSVSYFWGCRRPCAPWPRPRPPALTWLA